MISDSCFEQVGPCLDAGSQYVTTYAYDNFVVEVSGYSTGLGELGWLWTDLVLQCRSRSHDDLSRSLDLSRVLFSTPRQLLVSLVSVKLCNNIVDGLVNVELFTAENVDKRRASVRKRVNANVALSNNNEPAHSPLSRVLAGTIDERVGRRDLVHPNNVGKLIKQIINLREIGELPRITLR
jgi:hypothetical protein